MSDVISRGSCPPARVWVPAAEVPEFKVRRSGDCVSLYCGRCAITIGRRPEFGLAEVVELIEQHWGDVHAVAVTGATL